MEYWQHHQKTFEKVSFKYFNNNTFLAFNEVIYHMILSFMVGWRGGIERIKDNFSWNKDLLSQRTAKLESVKKGLIVKSERQIMEDLQVYLYKNLFFKILEEEKKPNA